MPSCALPGTGTDLTHIEEDAIRAGINSAIVGDLLTTIGSEGNGGHGEGEKIRLYDRR